MIMSILLNFLPLLLAIVCYVLAGVFKADPNVHEGLTLLAGALVGWAIPRLGDMFKPAKVATVLVLGSLALGQSSCHNVKPDQFFGAVVDCAKVNPNSSAALAQVQTCLLGAIAGNPEVCLAGLVTEAHFMVDEVTCVVAWLAQQENQKVAVSKSTLDDLKIRNAAAQWLAAKQITIRNSYQGACH
jgi:hypothetical protein